MARFNILAGDKPLTSGTKITGCGFNLPDIGNPLFRKPELKLYRRIINRKMRRGGYLKIARRQLNPRRRCRCGNPERYRRRIALLPLRIYRPDCQTVISQSQLPEAVCGFRRPGRADQPLTAVIRCHGQAKHKAHALHHLRRIPACQHWYSPLSAVTSAVRCCTAGGVTPFTVPLWSPSKYAPLSTMASFPVHAARR